MSNLERPDNNSLIEFLGFGMICAGLLIYFFLAREILITYIDFGSNGFFVLVTGMLNEKTLFVIDGLHSISIGEGGANVIAMLFLFFLVWTTASIAYRLMKSGSELLLPAYRTDVEAIKTKLKRVLLNINKNDS